MIFSRNQSHFFFFVLEPFLDRFFTKMINPKKSVGGTKFDFSKNDRSTKKRNCSNLNPTLTTIRITAFTATIKNDFKRRNYSCLFSNINDSFRIDSNSGWRMQEGEHGNSWMKIITGTIYSVAVTFTRFPSYYFRTTVRKNSSNLQTKN